MFREITIGQYYPADSILHRLDPRVKLAATILFLISLFIVQGWGYIICTAFLAFAIIISKVPFKFMVRGLKAIFIIIIITMALNLFLTAGDVVWKFGVLQITKQGIEMAVFMAIRLVYLILGASLMTFTTTPNKLTDALESFLSPLKVIRVPVHEISMMMSIALRFIPILIEEAQKIMKAQTARGADFESGNVLRRIKAMVPVLVPLFVSAFRRANDLALAMESRCYHGGSGRTHMKPLKYESRDIKAYIIVFAYFGAIICLRVLLGW